MMNNFKFYLIIILIFSFASCSDSNLDENLEDFGDNFPQMKMPKMPSFGIKIYFLLSQK